MLTMNTRELKLPDHLEKRRADIVKALEARGEVLKQAHVMAVQALAHFNEAVAVYNRTLHHADGWCIEAACVIELELIGQHTTGWETQTPEGWAAVKWRREIETASFAKCDRHPIPILPDLTHSDDLNALPRWPDDPRK
jgi:hypothetical protein